MVEGRSYRLSRQARIAAEAGRGIDHEQAHAGAVAIRASW